LKLLPNYIANHFDTTNISTFF